MCAGTVIRLGEKHGIPTPVNRKYLEAVRRMEERWS
jgi:ketopantoate reductase